MLKNSLKCRMKKILFVFGGEKASGAEFVIERLIRNISDSECFLLIAPGKYSNQLKKESLPYKLMINENLKKLYVENSSKLIVAINFIKNMLRLNFFVLRFTRKQKIDLIHCNTLVPSIYLIPSLLIMKVFNPRMRWVWSDHDLDYAGSKVMMKIAPVIVRCFDKTIVVSKAVLNKYSKKLHSKIEILYNGLNLQEITIDSGKRERFRNQYSIPNKSSVFGIMGQIVPRKGVLELIRVFSKSYGNQQEYFLLVAGSPLNQTDSYYTECLKIAEQFDNILMIGYLNEISDFYNGIDFLINNSSSNGSEPLGTTILEGMAYKKIVMVSNVGGSKEMVEDETIGIVYEPDSASSLKEVLFKAIHLESDKKQQMTENARKKIENLFEINKMKRNYKKIIDSVIM